MLKEEKEKRVYPFSIDGENFKSENPIITGAELRELGKITDDYELYLEVKGPGDDELISKTKEVDLSQPGREKFYSAKPNTNNG